MPLSDEEMRDSFWKKCHRLRRFKPKFVCGIIGNYLKPQLSESVIDCLVKAIASKHITFDQTPLLYVLAIAHISESIWCKDSSQMLKHIKQTFKKVARCHRVKNVLMLICKSCFADVCCFDSVLLNMDLPFNLDALDGNIN